MMNRRRRSGLWTIAYHSRMREPLSDESLASLAIHAQIRNKTLGVSGALFLSGDRFVQILEGDRGAMTWLYGLIAADPRHQDVVTMVDAPLDRRAFKDWQMRLLTIDDLSTRERETALRTLRLIAGKKAPAPGSLIPEESLALVAALTTGALRVPAFGPSPLAAAL